jgi:hypothetical protein
VLLEVVSAYAGSVAWGMEDGGGYSNDDLVVIVWLDSGSTRFDSGNIITPLCQLMFIRQLLMGSRYFDCRVKDLRRLGKLLHFEEEELRRMLFHLHLAEWEM